MDRAVIRTGQPGCSDLNRQTVTFKDRQIDAYTDIHADSRQTDILLL